MYYQCACWKNVPLSCIMLWAQLHDSPYVVSHRNATASKEAEPQVKVQQSNSK